MDTRDEQGQKGQENQEGRRAKQANPAQSKFSRLFHLHRARSTRGVEGTRDLLEHRLAEIEGANLGKFVERLEGGKEQRSVHLLELEIAQLGESIRALEARVVRNMLLIVLLVLIAVAGYVGMRESEAELAKLQSEARGGMASYRESLVGTVQDAALGIRGMREAYESLGARVQFLDSRLSDIEAGLRASGILIRKGSKD